MQWFNRSSRVLSGIFLVIGLNACEGPQSENLLARVGDRKIGLAEYREYVQSLPKELKSDKEGVEAHLEQLQSLIDKEILLLEAKAQGLDRDAAFLRNLKRQRDRQILEAFYRQEVAGGIGDGGGDGKTRREKLKKQKQAVLEALKAQYRPTLNAAGLERMLDGAHLDPTLVLYQYEGGTITVQHLMDHLANRGVPASILSDSTQVMGFLQRVVVPEAIVLSEAQRRGLDREIITRQAEQLDQLLGEELLKRQVKALVEVSYDEAKAYFDSHPELFAGPEYLQVQEILVATEAEADQLLQQIRDGADMADLATAHTLRHEGKQTGGIFHLHRFHAPFYGGLVEAAKKAPQDSLQGPIQVKGGFSIFRVFDNKKTKASFEDKRTQFYAKNIVTKIKQNERFDAYILQLREQYHDQIKIYKNNLRLVAAAIH